MTTYSNFWLISITAEQRAKTCGYWYLVQTHGGTPHTAFRSKSALLRWLGEMNLNPTAYIHDEGTHSVQRLEGSYSVVYRVDAESFYATVGIPTRTVHNARYVPATIVRNDDGTITLFVAHYEGAPEYDYRSCDDFYHGRWDTPDKSQKAA